MQSIRRKCPEPTGFIGNQCKLYIDFIYLENIQPTRFHWRSMQSIIIHIEHSEPTGFHWRSIQNIYTEDTQKQMDSIGDQCKVYIHSETQKQLDSTGSQKKKKKKIWAESTRSPLFLEISETDCCADYVYYLSNTLPSGSHRRSMLNETLTENARSQSCRPVSGAAVPRLPRGQLVHGAGIDGVTLERAGSSVGFLNGWPRLRQRNRDITSVGTTLSLSSLFTLLFPSLSVSLCLSLSLSSVGTTLSLSFLFTLLFPSLSLSLSLIHENVEILMYNVSLAHSCLYLYK